MLVPESPHWLLANHKSDQLRAVLRRMVNFNGQDINVEVRKTCRRYFATKISVAPFPRYVSPLLRQIPSVSMFEVLRFNGKNSLFTHPNRTHNASSGSIFPDFRRHSVSIMLRPPSCDPRGPAYLCNEPMITTILHL